MLQETDVIIIGAGAAGLMCAIEAGKRQRKVIVLDHANKVGKKILMSGGGRCNFTNLNIKPENYLSHNPHFCKSALSRYTQWDFINLVRKYCIPYHEKGLGQLFCDDKAKAIVELLLQECAQVQVEIRLNTSIEQVQTLAGERFSISSSAGEFRCHALVIASGGLSIPTMGASSFAYKIAAQFGIKVWSTRAGLVPLTLQPNDKEKFADLAGIAVNSLVTHEQQSFQENILFTHRGLSGPAILQISSYWRPGEALAITLLPQLDLRAELKAMRQQQGQKQLKTVLADCLPKRLLDVFITPTLAAKKLAQLSNQDYEIVAATFQAWQLYPNGTEGYRTAEVTLGGVDCAAISSKTMAATNVPGLYFIGEALDVTGWLGGFNFQWAWSSGWAAGQVV